MEMQNQSDQIPDMGYNNMMCDEEKGTLSFMEMLATYAPLSDLFLSPPTSSPASTFLQSWEVVNTWTIPNSPTPSPATTILEPWEVVNIPTIPNSCSVSSSSAEVVDDDKRVENHEENMINKELNTNKKMVKEKERVPRFAFKTKSDIDNLYDGYRWRKYGQKIGRKSYFPRSYYRCTTEACGVKKQVERSSDDPTIVITTYEGTHTHPYPFTSRGGSNDIFLSPQTEPGGPNYYYHSPFIANDNAIQQYYDDHYHNNPALTSFNYSDDGLLQDILPAKYRINYTTKLELEI